MEHFAFPGNIDFAAMTSTLSCIFSWIADAFIYPWNNVYNLWITRSFPFKWHRTTSCWKSSIFNRNSSGERRLKFIASGEDDHNKKPRAKHSEGNLNTVTTNVYRGSDKILQLHCKWSWWREITPTADASKSDGEIRQRLQFTVKLSSMQRQVATVTQSVQCTSRISFQRTEDRLSTFTPFNIRKNICISYLLTISVCDMICYYTRKINYFTRKGQIIKSANFSISQGKLDSFKEVRGRWQISEYSPKLNIFHQKDIVSSN